MTILELTDIENELVYINMDNVTHIKKVGINIRMCFNDKTFILLQDNKDNLSKIKKCVLYGH